MTRRLGIAQGIDTLATQANAVGLGDLGKTLDTLVDMIGDDKALSVVAEALEKIRQERLDALVQAEAENMRPAAARAVPEWVAATTRKMARDMAREAALEAWNRSSFFTPSQALVN